MAGFIPANVVPMMPVPVVAQPVSASLPGEPQVAGAPVDPLTGAPAAGPVVGGMPLITPEAINGLFQMAMAMQVQKEAERRANAFAGSRETGKFLQSSGAFNVSAPVVSFSKYKQDDSGYWQSLGYDV